MKYGKRMCISPWQSSVWWVLTSVSCSLNSLTENIRHHEDLYEAHGSYHTKIGILCMSFSGAYHVQAINFKAGEHKKNVVDDPCRGNGPGGSEAVAHMCSSSSKTNQILLLIHARRNILCYLLDSTGWRLMDCLTAVREIGPQHVLVVDNVHVFSAIVNNAE